MEGLQLGFWQPTLLPGSGHLLAPALAAADPGLRHGEPVAVDLAVSTALANRRGLLSDDTGQRILGVLRELELPVAHPACTPELLLDDRRPLPLPRAVRALRSVDDVTAGELAAALAALAPRAVGNHAGGSPARRASDAAEW